MRLVPSLPLEVMGGYAALPIFGNRRDANGPWQIIRATNCAAVFKNRPSRRRAPQYEPIITTALPAPPENLPTPVKAERREMQSRGFWLRSTCRNCCNVEAAYRTDQQKSADTALLIGVLSVALRRHVSKVPRAVDPAWRDVRPIADVKWLLRSSG